MEFRHLSGKKCAIELAVPLLLNILKDFPHSPTRKGLVISKFTPFNVEERGIL